MKDAAEMLREDLRRGGVEYVNLGRYFDFHAHRHSGLTRGAKVLPTKDLQKFGRHASLRMTMRYVHEAEHAEFALQVAAVPPLPTPTREPFPLVQLPDRKSDR